MPTLLPGLDALVHGHLPDIASQVRHSRIGLLTNHTGALLDGTPAWRALTNLGARVEALFSPEHGPQGVLEGDVASGTSEQGWPVYSLYGKARRPRPEMLQNLDLLVCDLQDVGARFYTYFSTIAHCLEEAAALKLPVLVLDRPNPLGGQTVEGPTLTPECRSFIGYTTVPVIHGMTMAELALRHNAEEMDHSAQVLVAPVQGWTRDQLWPATQLAWRRPSPNLPDARSAAWYPGLCLLEFSDLCVGRGTHAPFQVLAAPWLDHLALVDAAREPLSRLGMSLKPVTVHPLHAVHAGQVCRGVEVETLTPDATPQGVVGMGLILAAEIARLHPEWKKDQWPKAAQLVGSNQVMRWISNYEVEAALQVCRGDAATFSKKRTPYLLYS